MLQWTLERAGRIVPAHRIVTIVAAAHRAWWRDHLKDQRDGNVIVQPMNRGTAAGILLPLLRVFFEDPRATVWVLPSDHYVAREDVLRASVERALELAERSRSVVLLGMAPEWADPDYGWIVAGHEEPDGTKQVLQFVEKPSPALARSLYQGRASWSSFMLAARAGVLLSMFEHLAPRTLALMARTVQTHGWGTWALQSAYAALDPLDFSRDLLERMVRRLRLLEVPQCGWTDLGTPGRLARWVAPRSNRAAPNTLAPMTAGAG